MWLRWFSLIATNHARSPTSVYSCRISGTKDPCSVCTTGRGSSTAAASAENGEWTWKTSNRSGCR